MATLYHICSGQEWEQAQTQGKYRAQSLTIEGFIHCSTRQQVPGTAARFLGGQQGLVLLMSSYKRG